MARVDELHGQRAPLVVPVGVLDQVLRVGLERHQVALQVLVLWLEQQQLARQLAAVNARAPAVRSQPLGVVGMVVAQEKHLAVLVCDRLIDLIDRLIDLID